MRLGWDHCGYYSVSDHEMEGDMMWRPPATEQGERGQLLGPVALPRVSSGNADNAAAPPPPAPDAPPIAGHFSSRSINRNCNAVGGYDSLPLRWLQSGDRGPGYLRRRSSLTSTEEQDLTRGAFWKGSGAWRARFTSEDDGGVGRQSAAGWGAERREGIGSRPSLWRRLRWGSMHSAPLNENLNGSGGGGNVFERSESGSSEGEGTHQRTVRERVHKMLHLDFDPDFDTSRHHLVKLFNTLDKNGSGTISYEAMRMGLANLGTYSDLNYLMTQADMDKSKEVTLDGFVATVQEHAAKMFAAKREVPVTCFCYDYSPEDVAFRWVKTGRQHPPSPTVTLRDLMSERGEEKGHVRWICLTGSDPSLVIRLANRYGIHPLQVEDCLNPKERLKVDAYRAPVKSAPSSAAASRASPASASPLQASDDASNTLTTKNATCSSARKSASPQKRETAEESIPAASEVVAPGGDPLSPLPRRSTNSSNNGGSGGGGGGVGTVRAGGDDILHVLVGRISIKEPTPGRPSNFQTEQVSIFLVGDHTVLFIERTPSDVSDNISNRMFYAGSKLRLNNARYLVYSLMDSIVDDVFPIMQHFQKWLVELQGKLLSVEMGPSLEVVRAIQQISRDMHMITFYLRPMKIVATQLITDLPGNDLDLKRHLEDLRDHLLMLEEQALRMSTWSRSLNKDWVNEQQHRMNQVVYILTMVTSAFMPAQFLTGVFGMNFKFMPELNWRYSYASFWVMVALLAFTSYHVYKRHKWL